MIAHQEFPQVLVVGDDSIVDDNELCRPETFKINLKILHTVHQNRENSTLKHTFTSKTTSKLVNYHMTARMDLLNSTMYSVLVAMC